MTTTKGQKKLVIKFKALPNEVGSLKTRIAQVDAEIDQRVYQLYGLSEAEIKIVEAGTARKS